MSGTIRGSVAHLSLLWPLNPGHQAYMTFDMEIVIKSLSKAFTYSNQKKPITTLVVTTKLMGIELRKKKKNSWE